MIASKIVLAFTGVIAVIGCAQAQTYPSQDVHMVVGFAAGSGPDIVARFLANELRPKLGKPILVENKPGAVGNIATEYVAEGEARWSHAIYDRRQHVGCRNVSVQESNGGCQNT